MKSHSTCITRQYCILLNCLIRLSAVNTTYYKLCKIIKKFVENWRKNKQKKSYCELTAPPKNFSAVIQHFRICLYLIFDMSLPSIRRLSWWNTSLQVPSVRSRWSIWYFMMWVVKFTNLKHFPKYSDQTFLFNHLHTSNLCKMEHTRSGDSVEDDYNDPILV